MLNLEAMGTLNIEKNIIDRIDDLYGNCEYNDMAKHMYFIKETCRFLRIQPNKKIAEFILRLISYSKNPSLPKTLYKLLSYDLYNLDMELNRKEFIIDRLTDIYTGDLKDGMQVSGIKKPKNLSGLYEQYLWVTSVYIELLGRSWGYYELSYLYNDAWKNKEKDSDMKIIYVIVNKTKLYTLHRCKEESNGKEEIYLIDVGNNKVYDFSPWTTWRELSDNDYIDQRTKAIKFDEVDEIVDLCSDDTMIIGKLSDLVQI